MKRRVFSFSKAIALSTFCLASTMASCSEDVDNSPETIAPQVKLLELSQEQKDVLAYTPSNIIIAHRGSTFWAPEETEAAMRWARNAGADYLECDLQMTKDGVLLALHDDNLSRTTDIAIKFPGKEDLPANNFTFEELLTLDAGSWFNASSPNLARASFAGLQVITLEDMIQIAEGNRIEMDPNTGRRKVKITKDANGNNLYELFYVKDLQDNGNRPGIYPETKEPWQFPGIEAKLKSVLEDLKWYAEDPAKMKVIPTTPGKVMIANTKARVILQTFSKESLTNIRKVFPRMIPTTMLLWLEKGNTSGGSMANDDPTSYAQWINFAIANGATIMGPSIAGRPNNYDELLKPWMADMIHRSGMHIHGYSFDTDEQMRKYSGMFYSSELGQGRNLVDGWFTNKTDMSVKFFATVLEEEFAKGKNYFQSNAHMGLVDNIQKEKELVNSELVLDELGYSK